MNNKTKSKSKFEWVLGHRGDTKGLGEDYFCLDAALFRLRKENPCERFESRL